MPSYHYPEVKLTATRKTASGRREQKTFTQTLSPLNRTIDGLIKTRKQVLSDLHMEAQVWIEQGALE